MMNMSGKRYTDQFKKQIVNLYNNGKSVSELVNEYEMTRASVYDWAKKFNDTGSFNAEDNKTEEQKELEHLRKQNKQLKMENDILKQAALILGQKGK